MTDVKSKNLYELLGNDHDQDSDKEPEPPVKTVDKNLPRAGKRDAPKVEKTDAAAPPPRRNYERRGGGFSDSDRGFRDRTNARNNPNPTPNPNRDNPVESTDGQVRGRDSGPGTQRRGRGQGGPRRGGDRQNKTGRQEHEKQTGHGWGYETGTAEQEDEKTGEDIAQADRKEANAEEATQPAEPVAEPEPEPEDNNMSYEQYQLQQQQKRMEGLGIKEARAPNEGSKENKKWKNASALEKAEADAYFVGEARAKRERERVQKKQVLDIDYSFKEPARESRGGGRGGRGDRGGRGRGEFRGRGDRGSGGGYRGDRGGDRGDRGGDRGRGRANTQAAPGINETAFPALGGK